MPSDLSPRRWGYASVMWHLSRDPIGALRELHRRHGPTAVFRRPGRGDRLLLSTCEPAAIREVVTRDEYRNSTLTLAGPRGSAQRRIRRSLFRLHGEEHRRERRLLMPALQRRAVEAHAAAMARIAAESVRGWRVGEVRDLGREMKDLARRIATHTLFGESDPAEADRLGTLIERWIHLNYHLPTRILQLPVPGTTYAEMLRKARALEEGVLGMIRRRRATGAEGGDLLSALVRARDVEGGIPERNLVGQAVVLFLAAHETTAYALVWTLFLLSQHPEIAARLRTGLGSDADPGPGSFLEAVVWESLRLVPVVPYSVRVAARPTKLGPLLLPRGSRVLIPFDVVHRRADLFARPQRFDPDRWSADEPAPYSFLPFGAGLHMCIGAGFAMQTLRVTLAVLLRRFWLAPLPGSRVDRRVTVTIAPRRPLLVRVGDPSLGMPRVPVAGDVHDLAELPRPGRGPLERGVA
jgi:cytochrome P450